MLKKYLYLLFTVSIISFIAFGCKRNLVESVFTPKPTKFPENPYGDYTNVHMDVSPQIAPDGVVFGGYGKRFKFKGQWFVLADSMYNYNDSSKIVSKIASNLILKIENDKNITIYAKNLPYIENRMVGDYKDWHDDFMNNAWHNLKMHNLVIEEDRIYHEWNYLNYSEYKPNNVKGTASGTIHGIKAHDLYAEWLDSLSVRESGRGITYTTDLVNWTTETNYKVARAPMRFPRPSLNVNNKPSDKNFNSIMGLKGGSVVYFKGYLYVLGGYTEISSDGLKVGDKKSVEITRTKYHRIKNGLDTSNPNNWEVFNAPAPIRRGWMWTRVSGDKLFVNDGFKIYADVDLKVTTKNEDRYDQHYDRVFINNIYSTTDGVNWSPDTLENYQRATWMDAENYDMNMGPPRSPIYAKKNPVYTPLEPDYAELNGMKYIITGNKITIPEEKIREMAKRGETDFKLEDEDMKYLALYRLAINDGSSTQAVDVINPYPASMLWLAGSQYVFNLNNKIVRLVDYKYSGRPLTYKSEAESMIESMKYWSKIVDAGGLTNGYQMYSKEEACYYYLFAKATYEMYNYYNTNAKYYMPSKAITHYSIDFKYNSSIKYGIR